MYNAFKIEYNRLGILLNDKLQEIKECIRTIDLDVIQDMIAS